MKDYYLKFADEAKAVSVLYTMVPADESGAEAYYKPNYANIDTLGIIYEPAAEGEEPIALPGWHVNVRVVGDESGAPLEPFVVHPSQPRRVWG